jgi:hypothetical protein
MYEIHNFRAGDACAVIRVHEFLSKWGIINFNVAPETRPAMLGMVILAFTQTVSPLVMYIIYKVIQTVSPLVMYIIYNIYVCTNACILHIYVFTNYTFIY